MLKYDEFQTIIYWNSKIYFVEIEKKRFFLFLTCSIYVDYIKFHWTNNNFQ